MPWLILEPTSDTTPPLTEGVSRRNHDPHDCFHRASSRNGTTTSSPASSPPQSSRRTIINDSEPPHPYAPGEGRAGSWLTIFPICRSCAHQGS